MPVLSSSSMGSSMPTVLALAVISALVSGTFAVFAGYDGRPRPDGFDDAPTTTLGVKPAVKYAGKAANCMWYSWENYAYMPKETKNCSSLLWQALNAHPSGLAGFEYYAPSDEFFDPGANQYLCVIGCFDLAAAPAFPPAAPPTKPPVAATPATPPTMPPPVKAPAVAPAIPPTSPPSTPPRMMAPPPATLFRPPPPGMPLPPPPMTSQSPPAPGAAQAPGPASMSSGGSALRIFSATTLLVLVVAVFEGVL